MLIYTGETKFFPEYKKEFKNGEIVENMDFLKRKFPLFFKEVSGPIKKTPAVNTPADKVEIFEKKPIKKVAPKKRRGRPRKIKK